MQRRWRELKEVDNNVREYRDSDECSLVSLRGVLMGCRATRVNAASIWRQQSEVRILPLMVVKEEESGCAG